MKETENETRRMWRILKSLIARDYEEIALIHTATKRVEFLKSNHKVENDENEIYDHVVLKPLADFIVPQELVYATKKLSIHSIMDALFHEEVYTCVYMVKEVNQSFGYRKWQFTYYHQEEGLILYTRSNISDVHTSDLKQREMMRASLIQAEKRHRITREFISKVSHEIRTPLNVILGFTSTDAFTKKDFEQNMLQIQDMTKHISISIEEILDYVMLKSKTTLLQEESFQFVEFMEQMNENAIEEAKKKVIEYQVAYRSFVKDIYVGDKDKLNRILYELISNAIKYTPMHGKVRLSVKEETKSDETVTMCFNVKNAGDGMTEEDMSHMYEPFWRKREENGIGLGLGIARELVMLMGGSLDIRSIYGAGTKAVVKVPLKIERQRKQVEDKKFLVFVVHQDIKTCQQIRKRCEEFGMKVSWVTSNAQAFRFLHGYEQESMKFDYVFYDKNLETTESKKDIQKIKKMVKAHGEFIFIDGQEPLTRDDLQHIFWKVDSCSTCPCDFSGKRILIVEDHNLNAKVVKSLLEEKSAIVDTAENGLVAIENFICNEDGYYDAILMDIRMPLIDGITAAKSIRCTKKKDSKTIPIIAMSADVYEEDRRKTKEAGMNAHIAKPIDTGVFYRTLRKFL